MHELKSTEPRYLYAADTMRLSSFTAGSEKGDIERNCELMVRYSRLQGDHCPDNVKFSDNPMTFPWWFAALLPMLNVTRIMPVLVLLSVVGLGMQQCMIRNQNEMHKFSKVKSGLKYAANNKQF